MISIFVDESYAFDYLSILEIKRKKINNHGAKCSFSECRENIRLQLGADLFNEIITSSEYTELLNANIEVFNAVEKAKTNKISAKKVDDLNYVRYIKKVALQKRFFKGDIVEQKV